MSDQVLPPNASREQRMEACLKRLRIIVGILANDINLMLKSCHVDDGSLRPPPPISLADCLGEADALLPSD